MSRRAYRRGSERDHFVRVSIEEAVELIRDTRGVEAAERYEALLQEQEDAG